MGTSTAEMQATLPQKGSEEAAELHAILPQSGAGEAAAKPAETAAAAPDAKASADAAGRRSVPHNSSPSAAPAAELRVARRLSGIGRARFCVAEHSHCSLWRHR